MEWGVTVAETSEQQEERRRQIRDMDPETLRGIAEIIQASLLKIPGEIERLREHEQNMVEWLTEFAPDLLPEQYRGV